MTTKTFAKPFKFEPTEWSEGDWLIGDGHQDLDRFLEACDRYARSHWDQPLNQDIEDHPFTAADVSHRFAGPQPEKWLDDDGPWIEFGEQGDAHPWPVTVLVLQ